MFIKLAKGVKGIKLFFHRSCYEKKASVFVRPIFLLASLQLQGRIAGQN